MREIKFRFFYGVVGKVATYFHKDYTFKEVENGDHWEVLCNEPLMKNYSILDKAQYTGLKDKNGTEIYEGDIVSYTEEVADFHYIEVTVKVEINSMGVNIPIFYNDLEVIGNIYENPELVEEL